VRLPEPGSRVEERGSAAPIKTCLTSYHYSFVGINRFGKVFVIVLFEETGLTSFCYCFVRRNWLDKFD